MKDLKKVFEEETGTQPERSVTRGYLIAYNRWLEKKVDEYEQRIKYVNHFAFDNLIEEVIQAIEDENRRKEGAIDFADKLYFDGKIMALKAFKNKLIRTKNNKR